MDKNLLILHFYIIYAIKHRGKCQLWVYFTRKKYNFRKHSKFLVLPMENWTGRRYVDPTWLAAQPHMWLGRRVCWWILLLLCIITGSGKAGSRRLQKQKFCPHRWATRKDMSTTLLVNNEGIKYLFHSDLLSYVMFSTWSGYDCAVSEWTSWDHKIPLSCWIQEWIPAISYHPVTRHPSNTVSLTKKKEKPLFSNSTSHKKWSGST